MASHGTDQLLVQRLLTCKNAGDSKKALMLSGVVVFGQFALFLLIGVMLFVYYHFNALPPMTTNDQVFPAFIVRSLPHGVSGLVIAAIFAAAMSNLSGSLNSLASTSMFDVYLPLTGKRPDEATLLSMSRWLTAAWGLVLIGIAMLARGWGSVFTTGLTIASIVYGPMLGAFLLGLLTTRANQAGAITGTVISLASMIAVKLFTEVAWTWYVLIGAVVCMTVGYAVSITTEKG
jgi:Na+/proline symporter